MPVVVLHADNAALALGVHAVTIVAVRAETKSIDVRQTSRHYVHPNLEWN